jgi:hypothetical protein
MTGDFGFSVEDLRESGGIMRRFATQSATMGTSGTTTVHGLIRYRSYLYLGCLALRFPVGSILRGLGLFIIRPPEYAPLPPVQVLATTIRGRF